MLATHIFFYKFSEYRNPEMSLIGVRRGYRPTILLCNHGTQGCGSRSVLLHKGRIRFRSEHPDSISLFLQSLFTNLIINIKLNYNCINYYIEILFRKKGKIVLGRIRILIWDVFQGWIRIWFFLMIRSGSGFLSRIGSESSSTPSGSATLALGHKSPETLIQQFRSRFNFQPISSKSPCSEQGSSMIHFVIVSM